MLPTTICEAIELYNKMGLASVCEAGQVVSFIHGKDVATNNA